MLKLVGAIFYRWIFLFIVAWKKITKLKSQTWLARSKYPIRVLHDLDYIFQYFLMDPLFSAESWGRLVPGCDSISEPFLLVCIDDFHDRYKSIWSLYWTHILTSNFKPDTLASFRVVLPAPGFSFGVTILVFGYVQALRCFYTWGSFTLQFSCIN